MFDLKDKRFGKLLVLRRDIARPKSSVYWICICDCGKEKSVQSCHLRSGATKSCGCNMGLPGNQNTKWKGYGEIGARYWRRLQRIDRRKKPIKFNITIEYAWDLFLKQERKCALTGRNIVFADYNNKETTASLDRIDSSKGYEVGNVQWVHKHINRIKHELDQDYFIELCKDVALYQFQKGGSNDS